jgi:hypothetical protein
MTEDWRDARIAELEQELDDMTSAAELLIAQRKAMAQQIAVYASIMLNLCRARTALKMRRLLVEGQRELAALEEAREGQEAP